MSELGNENTDNGENTDTGNNESVIIGGGMGADGFLDGPGFGDDTGDTGNTGGSGVSGDSGTGSTGSNTIEFPEAISQSVWYEKIYNSDENSQTAKHLV